MQGKVSFAINVTHMFLKTNVLCKIGSDPHRAHGENELQGTTLKNFISDTLKKNKGM